MECSHPCLQCWEHDHAQPNELTWCLTQNNGHGLDHSIVQDAFLHKRWITKCLEITWLLPNQAYASIKYWTPIKEWKRKRWISMWKIFCWDFKVMKNAQMIIPHFQVTTVVFSCLSSLLIAPQTFVELTSKNKIKLINVLVMVIKLSIK